MILYLKKHIMEKRSMKVNLIMVQKKDMENMYIKMEAIILVKGEMD